MGNNEKYNVIFDLLAKAKEREGLDFVRLHNEIKKEIEARDKTFGKFLELVESLQDIIPKEKQRYNVAIKALTTTSGLSRLNVLESTDNQLEELKLIENVVLAALSGLRDELNAMESRSKIIKSEMAKLREQMAEFEKEEQRLLGKMAAREGEIKVVEEKVRKVFTDVGAEISDIRKKIEEFSAEEVSSQPVTPSGSVESNKRDDSRESIEIKYKETSAEEVSSQPVTPHDSVESDKRDDAEESFAIEMNSEALDTKSAKECPMCGGRMNLHSDHELWKCYSCGHEESQKDDTAREGIEEKNEVEDISVPQETKWVKECPMCGGRMNLHSDQGIWMCYSCGHEELGASELKNASKSAAPEPTPAAPKHAPAAESFTASRHKPAPVASAHSSKRRSPKRKSCPVCRKQMNMHEEEKTWKCPFCDYQRREF